MLYKNAIETEQEATESRQRLKFIYIQAFKKKLFEMEGKTPAVCECGAVLCRTRNLPKHRQSAKHKYWISHPSPYDKFK
jgi:hypothetical protein